MAYALVDVLAAGIPGADSGTVQFFTPGTLTQAAVYSTSTGTVYSQPISLGTSGQARVWVGDRRRMIVYNSSGTAISGYDVDPVATVRAECVDLDNAGWSATNANAALTSLSTSLNNNAADSDGKYKPASGATARELYKRLSGNYYSVKDYGAQGDNSSDDTTAIQNCINAVAATTYGGVVYFDPGIYRISAALTCATSRVSFRGAGIGADYGVAGASTIRNTSATANAFTITTANNWYMEDLVIDHTSTSTGQAIRINGCQGVDVSRVTVQSHAIGVDITDSSTTPSQTTTIDRCTIQVNENGTCVRYGSGGSAANAIVHRIIGGHMSLSGTGYTVRVYGSYGYISVTGVTFDTGSETFEIASGCTGTSFTLTGCTGAGPQLINIVPTGTVRFKEVGNGFTTTITDASNGTGNYFETGRHGLSQGANVASVAGAITLGADGSTFLITGGNAITSITATGWTAGMVVRLLFNSTATMTDGSNLNLAGNFVAAGATNGIDSMVLLFDGTNFTELSRSTN